MPPQKRRAMQRSPVRGIGKKRRTLTPKKTTPRLSAPNRAHIPTHTSTTDRQDHADGQPKSSEDVPWSPVADIAPDNPEIVIVHDEDENEMNGGISTGGWSESLSASFDNQVELLYLVKHGEELVRRIFNQCVEPEKLSEVIRKNSKVLKNNQNQLLQAKLFPEKESKIYSKNYDITVLVTLIRRLPLNLNPTEGWDIPFPKDEHVSKGDDIQRIYSCRNYVCHMTLYADVETLEEHKDTMLRVIKRLGGNKYANRVFQQMKTLTIPTFLCDTEEKQCDFPEHEKVKENVTDRWREDDQLYFETHSFEKIFSIVTNNRQSTIIGGPGVGKRALVRHLALKLEQQKQYNIVSVSKPAEISLHANPNEKQVFVLEDLSAERAISGILLSDFLTFRIESFNLRNDSKVLITMRTFAYFKARKHCAFLKSKQNVLDLESEHFSLNDMDKLEIFQSHCKDSRNACPEELLLNTEGSMFPALVHMFANKPITGTRIDFFRNPYEYLHGELERLKKEDKMQYMALLVFCFWKDCTSSTGRVKIICKLFDVYNLELRYENYTRLLECLELCEGTYIYRSGDKFEFSHQCFSDVIAYEVGKDHPDLVLRYISMDVVGRNVLVGKKCKSTVPYVKITRPEHFGILAKRIFLEMKTGDLHNAFNAKCLSNEEFTNCFINILREKPFQELKSTFLLKYRVSISGRRGKLFCRQIEDALSGLLQHDRCTSSLPESVRTILMFDDGNENAKTNVRTFSLHRLVSRGCTDQDLIKYVLKKTFSMNITKSSKISKKSLDVTLCRWIIGYKMIDLFSFLLDQCAIHNENSNDLFSSSEKNMLINLAVMSGGRKMLDIVKKTLSISDIHKCVVGPELSSLFLARFCASTGMLADVIKDMKKTLEDDKVVQLLIAASFMGNIAVLKMLLKTFHFTGTDTNIGKEEDGTTPLIAACKGKQREVVEHLLKIGADVNICDYFGQSPLYFASLRGCIDIVRILCATGAKPTLTTDFSSSAIKIAKLYNNSHIETFLAEEGIPNWNDKKARE